MKWVITLIIIVSGFAIMSKPRDGDLKKQISSKIILGVESLKIESDDNFLSGSVKALCRINSEKCAKLINDSMVIQTSDMFLYKGGHITVFGTEILCLGIFNTWKCGRVPKD